MASTVNDLLRAFIQAHAGGSGILGQGLAAQNQQIDQATGVPAGQQTPPTAPSMQPPLPPQGAPPPNIMPPGQTPGQGLLPAGMKEPQDMTPDELKAFRAAHNIPEPGGKWDAIKSLLGGY